MGSWTEVRTTSVPESPDPDARYGGAFLHDLSPAARERLDALLAERRALGAKNSRSAAWRRRKLREEAEGMTSVPRDRSMNYPCSCGRNLPTHQGAMTHVKHSKKGMHVLGEPYPAPTIEEVRERMEERLEEPTPVPPAPEPEIPQTIVEVRAAPVVEQIVTIVNEVAKGPPGGYVAVPRDTLMALFAGWRATQDRMAPVAEAERVEINVGPDASPETIRRAANDLLTVADVAEAMSA